MTVLSVLTVTGIVTGCDSDDGPTVTAPSGGNDGGGSSTPTRDTTAEEQGREQLEVNEHTIRNKSEERHLNIRANYPNGRHVHFTLARGRRTLRDPMGFGTNPTLFPCSTHENELLKVSARANGECWTEWPSKIDPPDEAGDSDSGLVTEADSGRKITASESVIIRFNYPEPKYYRLPGFYEMSSDPEGTGSPPTRFVCERGIPSANGECWFGVYENGEEIEPTIHSSAEDATPAISCLSLDSSTASNLCTKEISVGVRCASFTEYAGSFSLAPGQSRDVSSIQRVCGADGARFGACFAPAQPRREGSGFECT